MNQQQSCQQHGRNSNRCGALSSPRRQWLVIVRWTGREETDREKRQAAHAQKENLQQAAEGPIAGLALAQLTPGSPVSPQQEFDLVLLLLREFRQKQVLKLAGRMRHQRRNCASRSTLSEHEKNRRTSREFQRVLEFEGDCGGRDLQGIAFHRTLKFKRGIAVDFQQGGNPCPNTSARTQSSPLPGD